jgi:hypothetical protein
VHKAAVAALSVVALSPLAMLGANFVAGRISPDELPSPATSLARPAQPLQASGASSHSPVSPEPKRGGDGPGVDTESNWGSFSADEDYFREVLASPGFSPETKADVLETLGEAGPEAVELLLEIAAGAEEPELRAAAVESLAWLDGSDEDPARAAAPPRALLDLLESEADAEVRAELYSALAFDAGTSWDDARLDRLVERVLTEQRSETRLQGSRLIASRLRHHPDTRLAEVFDRELLPWLQAEASKQGSRYSRLMSVDALKLADTRAASEALHDLSRSQDTTVARAADHALLAQARLRSSDR